MIEGANFLGKTRSKENSSFLQAVNPAKNEPLPNKYFIATDSEIQKAMEKATAAFEVYKLVPAQKRADFLHQIADEILALGDTLIQQAVSESGLPEQRFIGERGRTMGQLKMFADLLREGSWVDARIDSAQPDRQPAPKPDIRNMLFPLGPVVVFGASNFPLAFSTAGGDTASALAAGCPVVLKAHESHPGTNELVTKAILQAAEKTGMPDGVFSSLNGKAETGAQLVQHPLAKAVGFTGSFNAGKAIFDAAACREVPIPVYAEMGSINPVFLLAEKLNNNPAALAELIAGSVTLGKGQFCTKPGILIAQKGASLETFKETLKQKLEGYTPDCLLNPGIANSYQKSRDELLAQDKIQVLKTPADEDELNRSAALASVDASHFLSNPSFHNEIFGPFTLLIECEEESQFDEIVESLEGQLTLSFMGTHAELVDNRTLINAAREKTGRVIFNSVPTGVEVCPSMHHGGPYPATTDSKFTSVGTGAIRRFARPIAFQDCPDALLPDELKVGNPLGIYRLVDGDLTK